MELPASHVGRSGELSWVLPHTSVSFVMMQLHGAPHAPISNPFTHNPVRLGNRARFGVTVTLLCPPCPIWGEEMFVQSIQKNHRTWNQETQASRHLSAVPVNSQSLKALLYSFTQTLGTRSQHVRVTAMGQGESSVSMGLAFQE